MAKHPLDAEIEARIQVFVQDLTSLVRTSALEAVRSALGAPSPSKKAGTRAQAASSSAPNRPGAPRRRKRVRRTAEQIDQLATRIIEYINRNGPTRADQLSKALGESSKDLRGPLVTLLEEKVLKTEGQRRGTKYLPA